MPFLCPPLPPSYTYIRNGVMSLPGLGLDEPEEDLTSSQTAQYDLPKEAEWRFEVAIGKYVQVKVCHTLPPFPFPN